jgi:signal transduction histidine kinase
MWLAARELEDRILIEISNTGEPIASEHLPHLFEPFYRVEESRPRQSGGSGLGLAIVKGIVTAHGGDCGVRNTTDGVLFWFSLPRARAV